MYIYICIRIYIYFLCTKKNQLISIKNMLPRAVLHAAHGAGGLVRSRGWEGGRGGEPDVPYIMVPL